MQIAELLELQLTIIRAISSGGRSPICEWKRGTDSTISTIPSPERRPRRIPLTAEVLCFIAWRTSLMYAFCWISYFVSPPMTREAGQTPPEHRGEERRTAISTKSKSTSSRFAYGFLTCLYLVLYKAPKISLTPAPHAFFILAVFSWGPVLNYTTITLGYFLYFR